MKSVQARYSHTNRDHNRLLLLALTESWGHKCYWCRTPKPFRDLQIDHIIPRRPRVASAVECDVDAAENLAPICGSCNQEKTNGDWVHSPRIQSQLTRAARLAETVQRSLDGFHRDTHITKVLLSVTAADLGDEGASGAVKALGGPFLSVLRDRFPELLDAPFPEDYTVHHPPIEYKGRIFPQTDGTSIVNLDGTSRRAAVILEDVLGLSMRYALDTVREQIRDEADNQVRAWERGRDHGFLNVFVDLAPRHNPIGVYFYEMRYERNDGEIEIVGEFEGAFVAEIEEEDPDPSCWSRSRGTEFDYNGEFSATFTEEGLIDTYVNLRTPEEQRWRTRHHLLSRDEI